jgi:large subunit ribosomal protein L32
MPAVPKKKSPKSRQGKRRSHLRMDTVRLTECPRCHSARPSHQVCPSCGFYRGREAVAVTTPELPSE